MALLVSQGKRAKEPKPAYKEGQPTILRRSHPAACPGARVAVRQGRWPATLDAAVKPRHPGGSAGRIVVLHPFALGHARAALDKGVTPSHANNLRTLMAAIDAAQVVVSRVWSRFHERAR
jgi:hypothetical protein